MFHSLEVVLSEDDRQNNIVAQHRLPYSFNVVARLPPVPPSDSSFTNDEAPVVERNSHDDNPRAISPPSTPPNVNESLNRDYAESDTRYVPCDAFVSTPSEQCPLSSLPQWIVLIKPLPWSGGNVIKLRRESHVALDIIPDRLPGLLPAGFGGIKIPATSSVVNPSETANKIHLEFRIHLYGATTKRRYEKVCPSCEKREGKKKGIPSLIDFHAERDIIEPKGGKIRIEFTFCCYPKDHRLGDTDYL